MTTREDPESVEIARLVLCLPLELQTVLRFLELFRDRGGTVELGFDSTGELDGTLVLEMRRPAS